MRSLFGTFVLAVLAGCSDGAALVTPQGGVNQLPTLALVAPASGITVAACETVEIAYVDDDPDDIAKTDLFADRDGDLGTTGDQIVIGADLDEMDGVTQSVTWNPAGAAPGTYRIIGRTTDGQSTVVAEAPGTVTIDAGAGGGSAGSSLAFAHSNNGQLSDLAVDTDGSFVIVGDFLITATLGIGDPNEVSFSPPDGSQDGFVARYNADGSLAWARQITGASAEHPAGVVYLAGGSCLVTGVYMETAVFGVGETNETTLTAPLPVGSNEHAFLARYDADGTLASARDIARGGRIFLSGTASYADGSFVMTGRINSEATFGPGDPNETVLTPPGVTDLFVARFNADGSLAWARRDGGAAFDQRRSGLAIATFADGSCVVAGTLTEGAVFGAGEPNETTLTSVGTQDTFVARYNADGTLAWAVGARGTDFSSTTGVGSLADGSCVVLGHFAETKVFGAGEPNETTLTTNGFDVFVARYNADGSLAGVRQVGQAIALDLAMLADGSFVIVGAFQGTTTFGIGDANETTLTSVGGQDSFVARYNADGTLAWARGDGGPGTDAAIRVGTLPNGSVVAAGVFSAGAVPETVTFGVCEPNETTLTPVGSRPSFVARFDPN